MTVYDGQALMLKSRLQKDLNRNVLSTRQNMSSHGVTNALRIRLIEGFVETALHIAQNC